MIFLYILYKKLYIYLLLNIVLSFIQVLISITTELLFENCLDNCIVLRIYFYIFFISDRKSNKLFSVKFQLFIGNSSITIVYLFRWKRTVLYYIILYIMKLSNKYYKLTNRQWNYFYFIYQVLFEWLRRYNS